MNRFHHHMSPSLLARGELLLTVDSPVWLQELNFFRGDILRKLSSYGVSAIRFRIGRVSANVKLGTQGAERRTVKKLTRYGTGLYPGDGR